jgi:hypothetical protein
MEAQRQNSKGYRLFRYWLNKLYIAQPNKGTFREILFMRPFTCVLLAITLLYSHCAVLQVNYQTEPPFIALKDSSRPVVLIDAGSRKVPGLRLSDDREEVVKEVKETYMNTLYGQLKSELPVDIIFDSSITAADKLGALQGDTAILSAISRLHNAALVMVLTDYSGGFSQDEVKKEKDAAGNTSKTAYYSVFFHTHWLLWQDMDTRKKEVLANQPHSNRSVVSGLLARGPGYKANKKAIEEVANANVRLVSELFKEQQVPVFMKKSVKKTS